MSQFTLTTHDGTQPSQLFELKSPVSIDDTTTVPSVEQGYYLLENADGVSLSRQGNALHLHSDASGVPAAVIPDFYATASLLTVPAENNTVAAVATSDVQDAPTPLAALMDTPDLPWSDSPVVIDVATADGEITENGTTTDLNPTIHGMIEFGGGMWLNIFANTEFLGSVQVSDDGSWSFTPPDSFEMDSSYTLQVMMKDPGGSSVLIAMPFDMSETADATPPADLPKPGDSHTIDIQATDAVGPHQGTIADHGNTDDLSPVIGGTILYGHKMILQIYANTQFLGSVQVAADDTWSFQMPELQDHSQYDIQVLMGDAGGGPGMVAMPFVFTTGFDYAAPTITSVTDTQGIYTGPLSDGQVTDATLPTITGQSDPGVTINVYDGTNLLGTAISDAQGNWSFTPDAAHALSGDGDHLISVTATDGTNETAPSDNFDLDLDTVCAKPVITDIDDEVGPITGNVLENGFITDAGSVVVSGTSEPGSTLTLFFTGVDNNIDSVDIKPNADGTWSVPVDFMGANGEGSYTYWVLSYDAAGNKAVSDKVTIEYDNTPPDAISGEQLIDDYGPKTGPIQSGETTDDTQPTYEGKAEPNDTVHIYDGSNEIGSVVADKDGNWSFTPADPLDQGPHSFSAIVVDGNGNSSDPSTPIDFTVQTLVAQVTINGVTDDVDPTGEVANNGFTNDATPTLHGTATIDSTVTIYDMQNGEKVLVGTAVADDNGNWTFTPDAALADGEHDFIADVTLDSGDSAESATWVINIDTVVPDQIDISVDGNLEVYDDVPQIIGDVTNGGVTNDNIPDFSGKNEAPGNKITILDQGVAIGTAIVDADGNWAFTPTGPMADGPHVITLETTDQAGNTSVPSDPFNFTIDTVAPDAATGQDLEDNVGPIVGPINSGDTTDDPQPEFSGKGEPGATVYVYDNGDEDHPIGSATVDDNGDWSFKPDTPLDDGPHSLDVVVVDPAGNESPATTPIDFTVDTRVPSVTLDGVSDDVTPVVGDIDNNGYTNDTMPTLHGTATAGAQVNIYDQNQAEPIGSVIAGDDGTWTFTPASALADGEYDFSATVVLPATGESAPTDQWIINIDTTVPDEIDINSPDNLEVYDDVPEIVGDIKNGGVTNDDMPTFSGKNQEPGNTITILVDGKPLGQATVQDDGSWSFTPPTAMAEGPHAVTLTSTDQAFNVSPESDPFNFTIDITAPDAVTNQQLVNDEGQTDVPITEGSVTDDTTPLYEGKAEPNSSVIIYDGTDKLGTVMTDASGNWSFTPPTPLTDGPHSFSAVVEDAAGNLSPASEAIDFIVSTETATAAITHVTDDVEPQTGDVANNGYTNDTMPTLTGTATANETVTIIDGKNGAIGTAIADADGNWTFTPATPLSEGEHDFTASVTIAVSGETATSDVWVINVDSIAPDQIDISVDGNLEVYDDVPAITGDVTNGGVTNDNMPDFSGKNEVAGNTIIILDGGKAIGSALVDADGNWAFTPPTAMADGPHVITLEAKDLAGNTSTPSDPFNFTIDTVPPDAAKDIVVIDNSGDQPDAVIPGGATADDTPVIDGNAEPGSTIIIYDNGSDTPMGSTTADDNGDWSFTPDTPMDDGPHSIDVVVVDPAGNESPASDPVVFSIITEGTEGFTGLADDNDIELGLNQAVTLDSGLILTSLDSGKDGGTYTNAITSTGMYFFAPTSFEGTALDLLAQSVTKVEFGGDTNEVSFDVAAVSAAGGYVEYFSADDSNPIYTQDIPKSPDKTVTNIAWEAPAGQTISYIEIHVGSENGDTLIRVDNFQWGDAQLQPLAATHDVAQTAELQATAPVAHNPAVVDVHQAGGQVSLDVHEVLAHGQQNMMIADGKSQVAITGEAGEHVDLTGVSESSMAQHGSVTSGGVSYDVYSVSGSETELLVQHGLDLHTTA